MAKVYHAHLWGTQDYKYQYLAENDINTVEWTEIFPESSSYLFIPQNIDCKVEYEQGWKITDIMPTNSSGMNTLHDEFVIAFDKAAFKNVKRYSR